MDYRPDIDGLRAIAVLAVLGYHTFPELIASGFVGVDVFFVISGFLISSFIFQGLNNNTFSFMDFYARRARRIFPALALVLSTALLFGWLTLLRTGFIQLSKHVVAGAAFIANVTFYRESAYFDSAAELKPLLHLWSLGIEEQFYLIWPLLAFIAWRSRLNPLAMMTLVAAVSFCCNVTEIKQDAPASFYLPASRFWELSTGSMLAHLSLRRTSEQPLIAPRLANIVAVAAMGLMAASITCLGHGKLFPGWLALLPTSAALLLIAAGKTAWINRAVLSARPMIFVGIISYPLYLWHWPILSFLRILVTDKPSAAMRTSALVVAFVLAWLTYRLVERPIRQSHLRGPKLAYVVASVASVGMVGLLGFTHLIHANSEKYPVERIIEATSVRPFSGPRLQPMDDGPRPMFRQGTNVQTALFIGDSNVEQYYPRIDQLLEDNPARAKSVVFGSLGGCPPFIDLQDDHHPDCDSVVSRAIRYAITHPEVDTVVIGAFWIGYFAAPNLGRENPYNWHLQGSRNTSLVPIESKDADTVFDSFGTMIRQFVGAGKHVYVILQIPYGPEVDPRRMVHRHFPDMHITVEAQPLDKEKLVSSWDAITRRVRAMAQTAGAEIIDPIDWLCTEKVCPTMTRGGVPIYMDESHLNPAYVRAQVGFLDRVLFGS